MSLYSQRNDIDEETGKKLMGRQELFSILISSLKPNDVNVRGIHMENYWELPETKERIRRYANQYIADFKNKTTNMPPLLVEACEDGNYVRNGDHRLISLGIAQEELAAEGYSYTHVLVMELKQGTPASRKLAVLKTADSKSLTVVEMAEQVYSLRHDDGVSVDDLALELGVSVQRIYQLLKTAALPEEVKRDIQNGVTSAKAATEAAIIEKRKRKDAGRKALISCLASATPSGDGFVTIRVPVDVYDVLKDDVAKDSGKKEKSGE